MDSLFSSLHLPALSAVAFLFVASTLSSFLLFRAILRYFPKFGFLDNPAPYGHDRAPVPF